MKIWLYNIVGLENLLLETRKRFGHASLQKLAGKGCTCVAADCSANSLIQARGIHFPYGRAEDSLIGATLKLLVCSSSVWASPCVPGAEKLVPQRVQPEQQQRRRLFGGGADNALVETDHTAAGQGFDPSCLLGRPDAGRIMLDCP